MPTVHGEVESKYEADGAFDVPSLVALFGTARGTKDAPADDGTPWAEGEAVEHQLSATYYDTAELDLLAAGTTLRRRTGGNDAGWHLKVPVSKGSRREVRVDLVEDDDS